MSLNATVMICTLVTFGLIGTDVAYAGRLRGGSIRCESRLESGVIAHAAAGGLLQFWISGLASFQGRMVSHDAAAFTLQGQFGEPRRFFWRDVKGLELLLDEDGKILTHFTPVAGPEISPAMLSQNPVRGSFEDAVMFAIHAHGPQIYNDVHCAIHLDAVVSVLTRFGITDPDVRIAAVLHDVIEDAGVSYDEVKERFGKKVADAVSAVSLPGGVTRDRAFEMVYPVIRATPGALFVKLADRIANVEDAIAVAAAGEPRHFSKYEREWAHFKNSLSAGADATARRMFEHLEILFAAGV